jgi:hypothetical protein
MRRVVFFFLVALYSIKAIALHHTDELTDTIFFSTPNLAVHSLWQQFDTNLISTDILIDRYGQPSSNTRYQNGKPDDSITDVLNWMSFYKSISLGKDTTPFLPEMLSLFRFSDSIMRNEQVIPIAMLNTAYNRISDSAFARNHIELFQGRYLRDIPGDGINPLDSSWVFSLMPIVLFTTTQEISLKLLPDFGYSSNQMTIVDYYVSLNQSTTYQKINPNISFGIFLSNDSVQVLNFIAVTTNGDTLKCRSSIKLIQESENRDASCHNPEEPDVVSEITYPNANGHIYPVNLVLNGVSSLKAKLAFWQGCNISGMKRKPILFIQGFNPRSSKTLFCYTNDEYFENEPVPQGWAPWMVNQLEEKLWRGTYYETVNGTYWYDFRGWDYNPSWINVNNGTNYLNYLRERGFDIFILVTKGGTDIIQNNAVLAAEAIRIVNGIYETLYEVPEELIVVGTSAGAYTTRYALTLLEKLHTDYAYLGTQNPYPHHRTKLWISFDGEFYGANTPIGFQSFVKAHNQTFPWSSQIPSIKNFLLTSQTEEIFSSPAGLQLSRFKPGNGNVRPTEGLMLMQEIEALKPVSRGYPQWCRRVALAQGSGSGKLTQNPGNFGPVIYPGAPMFDFFEISSWHNTLPILTPAFTLSNFRKIESFWNSTGTTSPVLKSQAGIGIFLGENLISALVGSQVNMVNGIDFMGWDYCPGSTLNSSNKLFLEMSKFDWALASYNRHANTLHSFAPTVGTFDLRTPESNYLNEESVFCNIDDKYDFFRRNNSILPGIDNYPSGHRFGYPHLSHPTDHQLITPFDALAVVPKEDFDVFTILPNHYHVDDFQPDFFPFLTQELCPVDLFIQNRDIGDQTTGYKALFQAENHLFSGQRVMQEYSDFWMEPEGEVIIDQNAKVEFVSREIILGTGFSVTGGAEFHAHLVNFGDCNQTFGERYAEDSPSNSSSNSTETQASHFLFDSISPPSSLKIFPNPISSSEGAFSIELEQEQNFQVQILDIQGRPLQLPTSFSGRKAAIMVSMLLPGMYFVKVNLSTGSVIHEKILVY